MKITGAQLLGLMGLIGALALVLWVMWTALKRSDDPARLLAKWAVTGVLIFLIFKVIGRGPFGPPFGAVLGVVLGIVWAPSLGAMLAKPLTSFYDGGNQEVEPRPFYSIAEAKRKRGKYLEAMADIRSQLEKFPEDFQGWMMLAELQAENMNDLAGAQDCVKRILSQEGHLPKNLAFALNRLADWHLKLAQDRESARATLERLVQLLPETEQAQLALQRIAHLATEETLLEKKEPHRFALPHHTEKLGLPGHGLEELPVVEDPAALADGFVQHLQQHPEDYEAREKLAQVYADHYQRLDLASGQLEQLLAGPHPPPKQVVRWLNLLADFQIRIGADAGLARQSLQRIVDRFPKSAAAENALNRMAYLPLEMRAKQKSQVVPLGSYEQNIGLKGRTPSEGDEGRSVSQSR